MNDNDISGLIQQYNSMTILVEKKDEKLFKGIILHFSSSYLLVSNNFGFSIHCPRMNGSHLRHFLRILSFYLLFRKQQEALCLIKSRSS